MTFLRRPETSSGTGLARWLIGRPIRWIADWVAGYDVFVSYAWADGRSYAEALSGVLQERRLRVFLDDARMDAGQPLRDSVARALRRSSVLTVVVTDGSLASGHVANEIRAFAPSERNIVPIVPPNLSAALRNPPERDPPNLPADASKASPDQCREFNLITLSERIWLEESIAIDRAQPDATVISKLRNAVGGFRRRRIRSAITTAIAVLFAALAVFAYLQRNEAEAQRLVAEANEEEATKERDRAVVNEKIATSRRLAAQSLTARETQLDLSLLLALSAGDVAVTREAKVNLQGALSEAPPVVRYLREHAAAVTVILHLQDGGFLTGDFAGTAVRWAPDGQAGPRVELPSSQPINSIVPISGGRIAISDFAGHIWMLERTTLAVAGPLEIPELTGEAVYIAWNPQDETLIAAYTEGVLVAWTEDEAGLWRPRLLGEINPTIHALALGPDNWVVVGTNLGQVALVPTSPDGVPRVLQVTPPSARAPEVFIKAIAFDAAKNRVAFDDGSGGVQVVDIDHFETATPLMCHRHRNDVYGITIDGDRLYSVGSDGRLRIAEIGQICKTVAEYQVTAKSQWSLSLDSSNPERLITGAGDGSVQVWDLSRLGPVAVAHDDDFIIPASVTFGPNDETLIVTGMANPNGPHGAGFVRAYGAKDLKPLGDPISTLTGPVTDIVFQEGSPPLLIGFDGLMRWPDMTQSTVSVLPTDLQRRVAWPGQLFATETGQVLIAYQEGQLTLCSTTDDPIHCGTLPWDSGGETIRSAAISADGSRLAIGSTDGKIHILDGETGRSVGEPLSHHRLEVTGLRFGREPNRLYSASTDGTLLIWDLATRDARSVENEIGALQQIAVSDDEQWIAASSQRGLIALWGKNGRERVGSFRSELATAITSIRFNKAGDRLAAAAMAGPQAPGRIVIWDVGETLLRENACRIANRPLTDREREEFQIPNDVSPCSENRR